MAVAARLGLAMQPLNLPAHLMLRPVVARRARGGGGQGQEQQQRGEQQQEREAEQAAEEEEAEEGEEEGAGGGPSLLVDAYNGGELCFLEDAQERLSGITGMQVGVLLCVRALLCGCMQGWSGG